MLTPELLHTLYGNIFDMLDMRELPDDKKKVVIEKLVDTFQERLLLKVVERMNHDHRKAFFELLGREDATHEEKFVFVFERIPDFPQFVEEELIIFKKEMVESVNVRVTESMLEAELEKIESST